MAGILDLGRVVGDTGPGIPAGGTPGKYLRKASNDDYDLEFADAVQSVNSELPDENGNVQITRVQFARQIETDDSQASADEYLIRTTGEGASIDDGDATLVSIRGRSTHTGYVAGSLSMTVNAVERGEDEHAITAEMDEDVFKAYVAASGTITLTYTTAWSANPLLYGITVTGTPLDGDEIVVVYVKEERGTITNSTPSGFVSTGWNLYDHSAGCARVKKYSDTYGFLIGGNYTALEFSETLTGTRTVLPIAVNAFTVPSDGYVWVTGGDSTTTYILMTWSDWLNGPDGSFEAYTESAIDLSGILALMPYGCLAQVGSVSDVIDLSVGKVTSNIERLTYSGANIETAEQSGRAYDCDDTYIYLVRETPLEYEFTATNTFTASDHGMEIITGSTVEVYVETIYGENLVDKIRHDIPAQITSLSSQIANIIQESVFTVEVVDNMYHLVWHGASGECPWSVTQSGADYHLNFTYNT